MVSNVMDAIQKLEEILAVTVEETLESMAFLIAERIGPEGCKIEGRIPSRQAFWSMTPIRCNSD